jgi:hypothetical protein
MRNQAQAPDAALTRAVITVARDGRGRFALEHVRGVR